MGSEVIDRRTALLALLATGCSGVAVAPRPPPTAFRVVVSGAGRPVIFIPGAATDGSIWDGTVAHLGGRVESHVLTLAGFSDVPPIEPPFLAKVRDQLVAYIRDRGMRKPVIVGHSLGGMMAFWIAVTEPDLLGGVVSVDIGLYSLAALHPELNPAKFEPIARKIRDELQNAPQEGARERAAEKFKQMITDPAKAEAVAVKASRTSGKALGQALYELYTLDLRDRAASIRVPVLALAAQGEAEPGQWPAMEASWRQQLAPIPRHELVIVPSSKHYIMVDAPEALYRALDAFLANV